MVVNVLTLTRYNKSFNIKCEDWFYCLHNLITLYSLIKYIFIRMVVVYWLINWITVQVTWNLLVTGKIL